MVKIPKELLKELNKKEHKYHAKRTRCLHGHDHDSQKEAMWCVKLYQDQKQGIIKDLKLQVRFSLDIGIAHICDHVVDFYYTIVTPGASVSGITEVKGIPTPEWKLKYKIFGALYPHIAYRVV